MALSNNHSFTPCNVSDRQRTKIIRMPILNETEVEYLKKSFEDTKELIRIR